MSNNNFVEYIKHLRTVHFSLLIVSAALLVGVKISATPAISTAISHAKLINSALELFDNDFLKKYSKIFFESEAISKANRLDRFWFVAPGQNCPSIQVVLTEPIYTILPLSPDLSKFIETDPRFPEELGSKIKTPLKLSEFKELWNALRCNVDVYIVVGINPNIALKPFIEIPYKKDIIKPPINTILQNGKINADVTIKYRFMFFQRPSFSPLNSYPYDKSQHIFMPMNSGRGSAILKKAQLSDDVFFKPSIDSSENFSGQKAFLTIHKNSNIPPGKFDDVFSELNRITKNIQNLSVSDIIAVLEDRKENELKEVFEIFGTKIPFREYARIGIPFILIIQLYFFIHLKSLNSFIVKNTILEVPWIGLYKDPLAKTVTAISVLFPILAITIVGKTLNFGIFLLFIIISIIISVITEVEFLKIWGFSMGFVKNQHTITEPANSSDAKSRAAD